MRSFLSKGIENIRLALSEKFDFSFTTEVKKNEKKELSDPVETSSGKAGCLFIMYVACTNGSSIGNILFNYK